MKSKVCEVGEVKGCEVGEVGEVEGMRSSALGSPAKSKGAIRSGSRTAK